jgi:hypothetical protein
MARNGLVQFKLSGVALGNSDATWPSSPMPRKIKFQHRLAVFVRRRDAAKFSYGSFHGDFRRLFAANPVDLACRNFQRCEQKHAGQPEIAFRVGGRNAALIRPEKMGALERNLLGLWPARRSRRRIFARCVRRKARRNAVLPARLADSISPSHALAACAASSSALAKEISSKFAI